MKKLRKQLLLGILVGVILSPSTAQAQFTVFDPAQYSLQIERQIEEANRWLERVKHYSDEINKLAEQLSTMKGVLGQAEKAGAAQQQPDAHDGSDRTNRTGCLRP